MRALQDKIAIVTGAGRGTGRALALKFASAGARLVIHREMHVTVTCNGRKGYGYTPFIAIGDVNQLKG